LISFVAIRFILNKQYGRALDVYLQLGNKDVFELIKKLNLFDCVKDRVLPLMTFDAERYVLYDTDVVIHALLACSDAIPGFSLLTLHYSDYRAIELFTENVDLVPVSCLEIQFA